MRPTRLLLGLMSVILLSAGLSATADEDKTNSDSVSNESHENGLFLLESIAAALPLGEIFHPEMVDSILEDSLNLLTMTASAQIDPGYRTLLHGVRVDVAFRRQTKKISAIFINDTAVVSPEGIAIGTPFGEVAAITDSSLAAELGFMHFIQLPCGWRVGTMWISRDAPIDSMSVKCFYRK